MKLNAVILNALRLSINESMGDSGSLEDSILSKVSDVKLKKEVKRYIANNVSNRANNKYISNLNVILNNIGNRNLLNKLIELNDAQDMLK